jgi:nicotinamide-nucleotide amidase
VSRPSAAILLTGSELLRGVISDRNASHLARELEQLGIPAERVLMVGDPLADIVDGLRELTIAHDLVITSGGLGPTHDDRTVEALAEVAGVPLVVDEPILAQITAWTDSVAERLGFERSQFEDGNRKQARIPVGGVVLGLAGTAPGLVMEVNGAVVVMLPGVRPPAGRAPGGAGDAAPAFDAAHLRHRRVARGRPVCSRRRRP